MRFFRRVRREGGGSESLFFIENKIFLQNPLTSGSRCATMPLNYMKIPVRFLRLGGSTMNARIELQNKETEEIFLAP